MPCGDLEDDSVTPDKSASCENVKMGRARGRAFLILFFHPPLRTRPRILPRIIMKKTVHRKGCRPDTARLILLSENQALFLFRIRDCKGLRTLLKLFRTCYKGPAPRAADPARYARARKMSYCCRADCPVCAVLCACWRCHVLVGTTGVIDGGGEFEEDREGGQSQK